MNSNFFARLVAITLSGSEQLKAGEISPDIDNDIDIDIGNDNDIDIDIGNDNDIDIDIGNDNDIG